MVARNISDIHVTDQIIYEHIFRFMHVCINRGINKCWPRIFLGPTNYFHLKRRPNKERKEASKDSNSGRNSMKQLKSGKKN